MPNAPALRLYRGHTTHQRTAPFHHRFRYGLSLIDLDIDRLDEADSQSCLFAVDRPGLFSFRRRDHGHRTDAPLRDWAEGQLAGAGITPPRGPIRLLTFPRHLLYKFAPISIWLAHDPSGTLRAIIYEVNNTFGDTHSYAAELPDGDGPFQHQADKAFHVSPFFDVSGKYRFTLRVNARAFRLVVETLKDGSQIHVATIQTRAQPANTARFLKVALAKPASSLMVTAAIHWQALKVWIKGGRYHARPKPPASPVTPAGSGGLPIDLKQQNRG